MKTVITLKDRYLALGTSLRVEAEELPEREAAWEGYTHRARLTAYQIKKIYRELPNGCYGLREEVNPYGKIESAQVYFNSVNG